MCPTPHLENRESPPGACQINSYSHTAELQTGQAGKSRAVRQSDQGVRGAMEIKSG